MYNPNDYRGETSEANAREEQEEICARSAERREEEERNEIIACERADAQDARDLMLETLNGWARAVTRPRYAAIGNGLFVRIGNGRRRRAA